MTGECDHDRSGVDTSDRAASDANDHTDHEGFPAATLDRMQGFIDEHGYLSWLGVELETASPGRAVLTMPYRTALTNPTSRDVATAHGGISATLIDTASGFALRTTFDDPARAALTTTDLDVSYLRPATTDLRVVAEVVRAGGTTGVTRATVRSVGGDGSEIAIGTTTYRLFRDRDDRSESAGASGGENR